MSLTARDTSPSTGPQREEAKKPSDPATPRLRPLAQITPPRIFQHLKRGVLGQDPALRFVSVAIYKHVTGKVPGNILLVGSSGTGKTTIMNNIQRLYHDVAEYAPFRSMTILNANLLVDSDRMEFRPDRLLSAVEQRARALLGNRATPESLKKAMERATVCIDEIDKMSTVVAGKPNPIGVVLQQGLLTLMEGEKVMHRATATVEGEAKTVSIDIDTSRMMFICGGAFEGLYDQVYERVTTLGSGQKLRTEAVRTADGHMRLEERFALKDFLKAQDLYSYGMVPQFMARFDNVVLLNDLNMDVLKEILLKSHDSPFTRSRRYFEVMNVALELEDLAAALISEEAAKENRTGARALRTIFAEIINPHEFDPSLGGALEKREDGGWRLLVSADMVRAALRR